MKLNKFVLLSLILIFTNSENEVLRAQNKSEPRPVWTEEQWNQAKQGIDYTEEEQKKKEEKEKPAENADNEPFDVDEGSGISEWLSDFFASPLIKILTIIVIIALLIVTIFYLMKSSGAKDNKLTAQSLPDLDNTDEHIEETDLDRFLRLSLEAGDFNTAIRILYLKSLQTLHLGKMLVWQKDKTNQDYLSEMRPQKQYGDFRELTYIYEVVWYGDQKISESEFGQLKQLFDKFLASLNVGNK